MTLKYRARVKIIAGSKDYRTPPALIGRTGRAVDRDGAVILVYLDGDPSTPIQDRQQYWAYESELEEIPVDSSSGKL